MSPFYCLFPSNNLPFILTTKVFSFVGLCRCQSIVIVLCSPYFPTLPALRMCDQIIFASSIVFLLSIDARHVGIIRIIEFPNLINANVCGMNSSASSWPRGAEVEFELHFWCTLHIASSQLNKHKKIEFIATSFVLYFGHHRKWRAWKVRCH